MIERSLSGVVRDITPPDLLSSVSTEDGLTLSVYQQYINQAIHSRSPYRHYCSAVIPS